MATLKFRGLCLSDRVAKTEGAKHWLEFQDMETETRLVVNTLVAVEHKHKFIPVDWVLEGFRHVTGTKEGKGYSFLTCDAVVGSVVTLKKEGGEKS